MAFTVKDSQRHWPKFGSTGKPVDPSHLDVELRLAYNGIYDLQDAFTFMASQSVLHPTLAGGAITRVDVLKAGANYVNVPTITVVGGGGTGAQLTAVLDRNGGIGSVTIVSGGSGFTSLPALVVTSND